jgi:hypothetical protein
MESFFVGDEFIKDREQALKQIHAEADVLSRLAEGTRNEQLFHLSYIAGQAIAAGLVRREEVEATILHAAEACGIFSVGDEDGIKECRATMRSGFTSGSNAPFFVVSNWFEKVESSEIQRRDFPTSTR